MPTDLKPETHAPVALHVGANATMGDATFIAEAGSAHIETQTLQIGNADPQQLAALIAQMSSALRP